MNKLEYWWWYAVVCINTGTAFVDSESYTFCDYDIGGES